MFVYVVVNPINVLKFQSSIDIQYQWFTHSCGFPKCTIFNLTGVIPSCYLLNKSILDKSTQTIYFLIVINISGHILKDIWVTNKVGISGALFFKKFEIFSFRWLRRTFQQFISHQKASFRQLTVSTQDHVNHRKPIDRVFIKFCYKGNFGGLGEHTNGSLATESPAFGT